MMPIPDHSDNDDGDSELAPEAARDVIRAGCAVWTMPLLFGLLLTLLLEFDGAVAAIIVVQVLVMVGAFMFISRRVTRMELAAAIVIVIVVQILLYGLCANGL